jgi:hypothetical protein
VFILSYLAVDRFSSVGRNLKGVFLAFPLLLCLPFPHNHWQARSITSLFVYGPKLSTNYLNPSAVPLLLLCWLWNISRTLYITPTYFTQVFLNPQPHSSPLNLDGWKLLGVSDDGAALVNDDGSGQGGLTIKPQEWAWMMNVMRKACQLMDYGWTMDGLDSWEFPISRFSGDFDFS